MSDPIDDKEQPLPWDDEFKSAGYKPFRDSFIKFDAYYKGSWQKRVTDDTGTLYFISVYLWVYMERRSLELRLQFRCADDEHVDISRRVRTIAEAETFARSAWEWCGSIRYE